MASVNLRRFNRESTPSAITAIGQWIRSVRQFFQPRIHANGREFGACAPEPSRPFASFAVAPRPSWPRRIPLRNIPQSLDTENTEFGGEVTEKIGEAVVGDSVGSSAASPTGEDDSSLWMRASSSAKSAPSWDQTATKKSRRAGAPGPRAVGKSNRRTHQQTNRGLGGLEWSQDWSGAFLHQVHRVHIEHLGHVIRPCKIRPQPRQLRNDLRHRIREVPQLPAVLVLNLLDR